MDIKRAQTQVSCFGWYTTPGAILQIENFKMEKKWCSMSVVYAIAIEEHGSMLIKARTVSNRLERNLGGCILSHTIQGGASVFN